MTAVIPRTSSLAVLRRLYISSLFATLPLCVIGILAGLFLAYINTRSLIHQGKFADMEDSGPMSPNDWIFVTSALLFPIIYGMIVVTAHRIRHWPWLPFAALALASSAYLVSLLTLTDDAHIQGGAAAYLALLLVLFSWGIRSAAHQPALPDHAE